MINFIKNDKYLSLINIIIILVFLFTKISYNWFLVIELFIISLYLIFMIYRFYLRSRVTCEDYLKVKELLKMKFKYDDYSDVYEDEDNFDLEIVGYKKLLNVVLTNFIRMDKKLDIESYEYLNLSLDNLKKCIKDNKTRKEQYELIDDVIKIIKKYYDKNVTRKDSILKYKKMLTILICLTIISIVILVVYLINKNLLLYSVISSIFILVLIITSIIVSGLNKDDKE